MRGSPGVPVLELGQPFRGLDSVPLHVRERRTVLAHQLAQAGAALLHVGQALRVGDDRLGRRPHLVVELGRFDLQRADAFRDRFERVTPGQRRDCGAERVLGRTLELGVRGFERVAVRFRVGEDLLLGCECRFFVGVVDGGGGDLVQLVAQQVDLPRARSVVAAERGQLGFDATPRLVRVGERGARAALAGSPAKRSSIARCSDGCEQRLVGVLTVQVDEVAAALAELGRGGQMPVEVAASAARCRNRPASGPLRRRRSRSVLRHAPRSAPSRTSDASARPPQSRSSASTINVLPAPVSPVMTVMPGPERHQELGDDAEVLDAELVQHRLPVRKVELRLQDLVEVARPQAGQPQRLGCGAAS